MKMKKIIVLLTLGALFVQTPAYAGILPSWKKVVTTGAVLAIGVAVVNAAKKHCHMERELDTGKLKPVCTRPPMVLSNPPSEIPPYEESPYAEPKEALELGDDELGLPMLRKNTTKELRVALDDELSKSTPAGGPPPDKDDCEAHHIVPQAEERKWAKPFTDNAKLALQGCVGVDSVENGIYLPDSDSPSSTSICKDGANHKKVHTKNYYKDLDFRLRLALKQNGCAGVKDELQLIKQELSIGKKW